ncbi:MAG TPA: ROK family protein [Amnibacterium sp.]|jgi:glucokinase|nr:ROK family protein [Amnibacterium sp.]
MAVVFGIDVGGTNIKARLVGDGDAVLAERMVPTPRSDPTGSATLDAVAALVEQAGRRVDAIGLAVPGVVDETTGTCRYSVNLGWRDLPVARLLTERTGIAALALHDVRAGAIGERWSGAGAGRAGPLAFVPLGTGLAVSVVDDDLRRVGPPAAGEIGHIRITRGPFAGLVVEDVASAGGMARRAGLPDAEAVLAAARAGDTRAAAVWQDCLDLLGDALTWLVTLTAPSTVVIGGGLANAGPALFEPVSAAVAAGTPAFLPPVELLPARHGASAAAVGAARLARVLLVDGVG